MTAALLIETPSFLRQEYRRNNKYRILLINVFHFYSFIIRSVNGDVNDMSPEVNFFFINN